MIDETQKNPNHIYQSHEQPHNHTSTPGLALIAASRNRQVAPTCMQCVEFDIRNPVCRRPYVRNFSPRTTYMQKSVI